MLIATQDELFRMAPGASDAPVSCLRATGITAIVEGPTADLIATGAGDVTLVLQLGTRDHDADPGSLVEALGFGVDVVAGEDDHVGLDHVVHFGHGVIRHDVLAVLLAKLIEFTVDVLGGDD